MKKLSVATMRCEKCVARISGALEEAGIAFESLLFWILLVAGYNASFELFNKWRLEVYIPRVHRRHTKNVRIINCDSRI